MSAPATTSKSRHKKNKAAGKNRIKTRKKSSRGSDQDVSAELLERAQATADLEIDFIPHDEFSKSGSYERMEEILVTEYENKRKPRVKPSPELPAYFAKLYETPLLTPQEEHDLFWAMNYLKYRANMLKVSLDVEKPDPQLIDDIHACLRRSEQVRDRIVQANLRLIVSLARKFSDQYSTFEELVSDGNVTLINATEKFDCSRGFRFSTYATHATQRDYYRQIKKRRKNAQRIASDLNEFLGDLGQETEEEVPMKTQAVLYQKVMEVFEEELDDREQHIVCARFGINEQESGQTLRSVGEQLGISKERVRQLQMSAVEKLKEVLLGEPNVLQLIDNMPAVATV
ncbi:MAG: sigma-70 family RNA polymerase sigma factor [Planctomycetaceae bacterium]|nr:sigma-70 family RNA polymerase sigma factor [Planctomycetaceae bacterium]